VGIGFLLLIIPGIILLVMFSVAIPVVVVENRRGTDAMRRSWELVSNHFWHVLGVILVAAILAGIVSGLVSAIGGSNGLLRAIFQAIAQIITAPFTALVSVLLYLDLRARRENLTASGLRAELATNR
jgi:TRAP-type C4-dicarboxylate transport system permease large subunit